MHISFRRYYEIFARYLRTQRARFALLAVLLFTSIGLQIVNPQLMRFFLDAVHTQAPMRLLLLAAVLFIAIALVQQAVAVGAAYTGEYVAWVATNALREDLATHCLRLDMDFHHEKNPGQLIERIEGDALEFATFFASTVLRVVANGLLLAGILVALWLVHWQLGAAFTLFALCTLLALNAVRGVAVPYQKAQRDATTEVFGFVEEHLAGTEDIRASGAVDFVLARLVCLHGKVLRLTQRAALMQFTIRVVAGLLLAGGFATAFVLGYTLWRGGVITVGVAYMVVHYTGLIARPIRELTQQVEGLQNIGATVERITELLSTASRIADGPGADWPAQTPLALEFSHVSFGYLPDKRVLHDVSFRLEPGQVLGVLGRTGSGKTTLARLIFRLYDPDEGALLLDGTDLRRGTLAALRQRVAFVTQDVQLFQASVRDNITFFNREIPDARIREVIAALELGEWFARLPDGLDTRLLTGGRSLSAGEAQLLAFTRVFLRDPGLVILDEASSRLDPATETLIERAIDHLLQGRSALIIAHRLGTLQRAREVLILEEGRVVEYGERLPLLRDPASRFAALHRTGLEEVLQ